MSGRVSGLAQVMTNLQREIDRLEEATQPALNAIALVILRESNKLVPVDTGNLRQSGQISPLMQAQPATAVFYSAEYAVHVHEDLEARHPTGESKFLEKGIRNGTDEGLRAAREEMRVRR